MKGSAAWRAATSLIGLLGDARQQAVPKVQKVQDGDTGISQRMDSHVLRDIDVLGRTEGGVDNTGEVVPILLASKVSEVIIGTIMNHRSC